MAHKKQSLNAKKWRLIITITISFAFFLAELTIGLKTRSLALVADAFHYLNDVISFVVALVAVLISSNKSIPRGFSFGWLRAQVLGAFFNSAILIGLAVSILVQAIQRFINVEEVEDPMMVVIVGAVGLGLNMIMMAFLHDHSHGGHGHSHSHSHSHNHDQEHGHSHSHNIRCSQEIVRSDFYSNTDGHEQGLSTGRTSAGSETPLTNHHTHRHVDTKYLKSPTRDLGMLSILIHVIGDAINNIGVIISGAIIWKFHSPNRYYIDPAISVFISIMIMLTTLRVTMKSGRILMETAPEGIDLQDIKHDLEMIPGIKSVPELNVWRLDEEVVVASIHLVVSDLTITDFASKAKIVGECLSAYGIHSYTLQPELQPSYNDKLEISTSTAVVIPAPTVSIPPRISSTNAIIGAKHSPASSLLESPKMVKVQLEDTQHTPALSNTKLEEQQKTE